MATAKLPMHNPNHYGIRRAPERDRPNRRRGKGGRLADFDSAVAHAIRREHHKKGSDNRNRFVVPEHHTLFLWINPADRFLRER
jgi:hypothetical protein